MKFLSPLLALAAVAPIPTSGRLTNNNNNNNNNNRRRQTQSSTTNINNDPRSVERKALAPEVDLLGSVSTERHLYAHTHMYTHTQLYPECVDLGSAATCLATLKAICDTDPARFPNLDTGCASLHAVVETARDVTSPDYNLVGIIPDPTGNYAVGPHGNCLQHYELPWMINGVETDVGPFDCTVSAGVKCLTMEQCCDVINGSGIPLDDRGNALQCYIFPTEQAYEDADPDRVRLVVDRFTGQVRAARIFHSPHSA